MEDSENTKSGRKRSLVEDDDEFFQCTDPQTNDLNIPESSIFNTKPLPRSKARNIHNLMVKVNSSTSSEPPQETYSVAVERALQRKSAGQIRNKYLSKLMYHRVWLAPVQKPRTH